MLKFTTSTRATSALPSIVISALTATPASRVSAITATTSDT